MQTSKPSFQFQPPESENPSHYRQPSSPRAGHNPAGEDVQDAFLEAFMQFDDEDKYEMFVAKHKKPKELPDEILDVGFHDFVPYINSRCRHNTCIYDISFLHEQYAEQFDINDNFKPDAKFLCVHCDREIKYGDFFTCDALTRDIETLFKQAEGKRKGTFNNGTPGKVGNRKANSIKDHLDVTVRI